MTMLRLAVLIQTMLLLVGSVLAKDAVRAGGGDGHLAVRDGDRSDWQVVSPADVLPVSGRWRTSAAGACRVDLPGGTLFVGADSELEFDLATRRIVPLRGRLRLMLAKEAAAWEIATKLSVVVCPGGSEVDVTADESPPVINVLQGEIRLTRGGNDVGKFAAPVADVDHGRRKSSEPPREADAEAWANRLRAATRVRPAQGMGQLVAKDAQSDSPVRLEVARYHVNVVLHAPVALVQIDQSFFNPYGAQQEGTFVFNLPHGASVSRFAMYVEHDKLIEGELIDRKRADEVYTTIVRSKRDPAILEQIGDNLFRMRVFPIFARDTKRILLDYTVPLVAEAGRYRFDLPLMSDLKPIWDFGLTGTIHRPFESNSISSPTHPQLKFTATGDTQPVMFSLAAKNIQPPPSFAVEYRAPQDRKPEARGFLTQSVEKGETIDKQHFIVTLPETENPSPREAALPANVLVLVDTSGSAGNLTRANLAARTLLNNLRPEDRVRLGCVDVGYRPLTESWLTPGSDKVREALHKLDAQFPLGASNLEQAVEEAVKSFDASAIGRKDTDEAPSIGRRRIIVYIGDGVATQNVDPVRWNADYFGSNVPNPVVFHAVHIADGTSDRSWLRSGMNQTGGRLIEMNDPSIGLGDLFAWSLAGLPSAAKIESVRVADVEEKDLFVSGSWPYGRELHLYGRYRPTKSLDVTITVTGQPAKKYSIALSDKPTEDDVFTGRLWAQHKLQQLLTGAGSQSAEGRTEIVDLCQEWSLMSPHTAFLVLESEEDYGRWKIDRKKRHRYWKPSGTIAALPLPPHLRSLAPPDRKTSPNETAQAKQPLAAQAKLERAAFDKHLAAATRALSEGDAARAMAHLSAVRATAKKFDTAAFDALHQQAKQKLQRETTLGALKLWRPLADRRAGDSLPALTPLLLSFAHGGVNPEFLERHPHADKLVKPAPAFNNELPLKDFARAIQESIGIPVLIDTRALQDDGLATDQMIDVTNLSGVSYRSLLAHVLEPLMLECVPTRHLLRITTKNRADEQHTTQVYPVLDLLRADVLPPPGRLAHPYIDFAEATQRRRTEARLKQPISVKFVKTPLNEVLAFLSKQLGEPIWLDKEGLSADGIATDQPVTLDVQNLPAKVVLQEILDPLSLTHVIRDEVLNVITQVKADEWLETRIYSAAGIVDDLPLAPVVVPFGGRFGGQLGGGQQGGGMGGFGGGGFGGGFGGGGGGFGGFMPGMIGVGGGDLGGGPMRGAAAGASNAIAGLGDVAPPMVDEAEPNGEPGESNETDDSTASGDWDSFQSGGRLSYHYDAQTPLTILHQNTSGRWELVDGEGGVMEFHKPSFSFVIQQTQRVHEEIQETLAKLRRLPTATRSGRLRRSAHSLSHDLDDFDYSSLMTILQGLSSQRWTDYDGEGGSMSPHPLTASLTIRQSARGHEEIERILVQLRRARYVAESLPWQTSLEGIDDLITLFDRPTITDLPRGNLEPKPAMADEADERKRLAIRKVPAAINQRWRSVSSATGQRREMTARRDGARMELVLPDRTLRAEGPRAAVAYPRLTLVEIEAWGDAARQVADSALPWLPHRSNEELAREFDVSADSEDATSVTLRLDFADQKETFLKATFSKQTGLPVKWLSVAANEPQYELQFAGKLIVAVDPNGKELERWELISDDAVVPLKPLDENWGGFVVVDPRVTDAPLALARAALRKGEYAVATEALAKLVAEQPEQPLLNFLLAWSCEFADKPGAARARQQRAALARVAAAGPSDLLRLLTAGNFNTLGSVGLHDILLAAPLERRTAEYWDQLAELAIGFENYEVALTHVDHAIAVTTDEADRVTRQLLRVELLLRNKRPREAEAAAKQLAEKNLTTGQLAELGDYFGREGLFDAAALYFERVRRTGPPTGEELAQLLFRQARWHQLGERRWSLVIAAEEALPLKHADRGLYGSFVLQEADQPSHAAILGRLADTAKHPVTQTHLRVRQAELTDDFQLASDIALDLLRSKRIGAERRPWIIEMLQRANRHAEIVQLLEPVLRRGERLTPDLIRRLTDAYTALGRTVDARRGESEATERPPAPQPFPWQQPWRGGGGGFFSIR